MQTLSVVGMVEVQRRCGIPEILNVYVVQSAPFGFDSSIHHAIGMADGASEAHSIDNPGEAGDSREYQGTGTAEDDRQYRTVGFCI